MSWPSKWIVPPVGFVEPQDGAADRGLAAAGLAHEAERLAAPDLKRDVVDCPDVPDMAVEDEPALDREVDLEVLELDEPAAVHLRRRGLPGCGGRRRLVPGPPVFTVQTRLVTDACAFRR